MRVWNRNEKLEAAGMAPLRWEGTPLRLHAHGVDVFTLTAARQFVAGDVAVPPTADSHPSYIELWSFAWAVLVAEAQCRDEAIDGYLTAAAKLGDPDAATLRAAIETIYRLEGPAPNLGDTVGEYVSAWWFARKDEEMATSKLRKKRDDEGDDAEAREADYRRACVTINPDDINGEYMRLPGDLSFWNARYADAVRGAILAEANIKATRAQLSVMRAQDLQAQGTRPTEAAVKNAVEGDELMMDAHEKHADAEALKNDLYGVIDAIRAKKECLISLGANMRREWEADPMIREQASENRPGRHRALDDPG